MIASVRTFHDARTKSAHNAKGRQGIRVKVSRSPLVHRSGRALLSRITVHESILLYRQGPHSLPALAVLHDGSTQRIPVVDGNIIGRIKKRNCIDNVNPPRAFGVARHDRLWLALVCGPSSERILTTKRANPKTDPGSSTICANHGMHAKPSIDRS